MSKTMFELDEWVVNANHIVAVRKYPDNKGDVGSIDVYLSQTPPNVKMLEGPIHYTGNAAKAVLEHLRFTHITRSLTSRVKELQAADQLAQEQTQDDVPDHLKGLHVTVEEARKWIALTFTLLSEFGMKFLDTECRGGQQWVEMYLPGMEADGNAWMTLDQAAYNIHDFIHMMLEDIDE